MESSLDRETRSWLGRYLSNEITLRTFEDWFVPRAWNARQHGDIADPDPYEEIELRLAEYTSGHWTEDGLNEKLQPLVARHKASA